MNRLGFKQKITKLRGLVNFVRIFGNLPFSVLKKLKRTSSNAQNDFVLTLEKEALDLELILGTTFKIFDPIHKKLAKRSRLYYQYHRLPAANRLNIGALAAFSLSFAAGATGLSGNSQAASFTGLKSVQVAAVSSAPSSLPATLSNIDPTISYSDKGFSVGILDKNTGKLNLTLSAKNKNGDTRQAEFALLVPKNTDNTKDNNDNAKAIEKATTNKIKADKESAKNIAIKENNSDKKTYALEVNSNLTAKYQIQDNKIKEDIIISSPNALSDMASIDFDFNPSGLSIQKNLDGSFNLKDEATSESLFFLPAPTLEDKAGTFYNDKIALNLDKNNNLASLEIDPAFLQTAKDSNLYPLTIDPTVVITTSTATTPNSYAKDHTLFEATNGSLINIYSDGSTLAYRVSTDKGNTWSNATPIVTSSTTDDNGFSGWIDSNNMIHLVYSNNGTASYIFYRKLTFSTSNNTINIGAEATVESAGTNQAYPTVTMNSSNVVIASYRYFDGTNYTIRVKTSSDGTTWSASTTLSDTSNTSAALYPTSLIWNYQPVIIYNYANTSIRWNYYNGTDWQTSGWTNETITTEVDADTNMEFSAVATSDNYLHLSYRGSGTNGIRYLKNTNGAANWEATSTAITTNHNDREPSMGVGTNDAIYLYYSEYVGADSYNIKYTEKIGNAPFNTTKMSVTTDNANNIGGRACMKPGVGTSANYGINLNGITQYVNLGNQPQFKPDKALTVSAWFNKKGTGDASYDFVIGYNQSYAIYLRPSDGKLRYRIYTDTYHDYTGSTVISNNQWYHLVMTYDANTGALKGYLNGSSDLNTTTTAGSIYYSSSNLYLGAESSNSYKFNGIIDEPRIFNRTLTQEEIQNEYNNGVIKPTIYTTDLKAAWHLDENTGATVRDYIGNSSGTTTGSPTWASTNSQISQNNATLSYSPIVYYTVGSSSLSYAPGVKRWTAAAAGNWSTDANWTPAGAPVAGDTVIFDGTSIQNCTVDSIADQIGNLYVNTGYTGTITFNAHPSLNADTFKINVLGDIAFDSGTVISKGDPTVQHDGVTDGRGNEYVAQNLTIGSGGNFNADGQGFAPATGPGKGSHRNYAGSSYGGDGSTYAPASYTPGTAYGDYSNPVSLGSGGNTAAGGAIVLSLSNTLNVNGNLSANGITDTNYAPGTGGSLNITAKRLVGVGSILANSGSSGAITNSVYCSSGGGRIKLGYEADQFDGVLQAKGGGTTLSGGAGTIFKKTNLQLYGDLFLNNDLSSQKLKNQTAAHLKGSSDTGSYQFDSITLSNYGKLAIETGQTLALNTGVITGNKNSGIVNAGTVNVPDNWNLSYFYSSKNGTIAGWSQKNLTIASTGFMTHYPNGSTETYKLQLSLDSVTVQNGGEINTISTGYQANQGPGKNNDGYGYSGGGHGGEGGGGGMTSNSGSAYGDFSNPTTIGSGGGGFGGGAIIITTTGNITVESGGIISSNGYGLEDCGGGAGGSVNLTAANISNSGTITANGGISTNTSCGGGGGGRIRLVADSISAGTIQARGGFNSGSASYAGAAGTIYEKLNSQTNGDLIIDNGTAVTPATHTRFTHLKDASDSGSYQFDSLTLSNYGKLSIEAGQTINLTQNVTASSNSGLINAGTAIVPDNWTLSYFYSSKNGTLSGWTQKNLTVTSTGYLAHYFNTNAETYKLTLDLDSLTIENGGKIDVSEMGYSGNNGPGKSSGNKGAGYGGDGGNNGGLAYGSFTDPVNIGSASYYYKGGGAIILNVTGEVNIAGSISANGQQGYGCQGYGGGSGGSINITANSITGNGTINANGGDGGYCTGASGGGGRISLKASSISSSLTIKARSPKYDTATYIGGAGTIYKKLTNQTYGDLIIDNDGVFNTGKLPADTPITLPQTLSSITVQNYGKLRLDVNADPAQNNLSVTGNLTVAVNSEMKLMSDNDGAPVQGSWPNITVSGNATVAGTISANGSGFIHDSGPGKGLIGSNGTDSGAGYGGIGGSAAGGTQGGSAYGTEINNAYLGSGGGDALYGGAGGGMVKMNIQGNLDIANTGTISANGDNGASASAGGGSGGSMQIVINGTLTGTTGSKITANGGAGGATGGGGGAGGRISLYPMADNTTGMLVQANGGAGAGTGTAGANGTVRIQHGAGTPTIIAPQNDGAANQSQHIAFRFRATDLDNDWLQYKVQLATDAAFTQNLSTFDQTVSQEPSHGERNATFSGQDHFDGGGNPVGYASGTEATLTVSTTLHQGDTFYYRAYAYDPEGVDSFDGTQHWSAPTTTRSFTVAPISKIVFTTAVQNIYVTNCSGQYGFQIQNSISETVLLTDLEGSVNVRLATTSGTGGLYSDGSCSTPVPGNTVNIPVGSASGGFYYKDTTPSPIGSPWTVSVSENPSRGWADGTQPVTVKPARFGYLEIAGYPAQVTAGESFATPANDVSVIVRDIYGNVKNDWTGQIWFYSSDSLATFSYNDTNKYTFTSGIGSDNGIHAFAGSGFTLRGAGNQSLVVHNTEGAEYDAIGNVNVVPAALDHFGLTSYPRAQGGLYAMSSMDWSNAISAGPYNPRVTAYDAFNNVSTGFSGNLWFELYRSSDTPGDPTASTASYAFTNDYTNPYSMTSEESGVHTFPGANFTVITSGDDLKLRVKTDALGGKYSDFTISIKPQDLDHFILNPTPNLSRNSVEGEKAVDTTLTENITVTAYDGYGNVKTDYGYNSTSKYGMIYFYSSDAKASLPYIKTDKNISTGCFQFPPSELGVHTFTPENQPSYFKFQTGGYQTLSVSECIDPASTYATDPITNKYDPRLEPRNTERRAASTGIYPAALADPNKIYVATHIPGSTHTATDHAADANDLISADPGHQQSILSWHNSFDVPADAALEPQAYIYRCESSCDDPANFQKITTNPGVVSVSPNTWSTYTDTGLTNDVTYYYKVSYAYKKLNGSFLESDKSITVNATPADIAPRDVVVTQLDRTDSANPGKVKVDYKLRWDSTVSLAYFNPTTNSWVNATAPAQTGDVGAGITGSEELSSHTAYFNPKIDFNNQYLVDSFKMRVKVHVNAGNAYSDSNLTSLDSKDPIESTLVIDATNASTVNLTLHSSDQSLPLQMQVSTNQDFSGANWEDYQTSKTSFPLDDKTKVYVRYRDLYYNVTTLSRELTGTPTNLTLKDGSNIESGKYRLLLIWDDITPVPQGYQVYRSVDDKDYTVVETTIKNAFVDINLNPDTTYYYKVQAKDENGNLGIPTGSIHSRPGTAPDVVAPPQVELFGWKQDQGVRAKISWHTDQNADSFVAYSTEPIKEGADLTTSSGSNEKVKIVGEPDMTLEHEIMLYNLDPSIKYYYKVLSKNEIQVTGFSPVYDFTTPERILLEISGVSVSEVTQTSALVSWTTSKLSTSIVEYGETNKYGNILEDKTLNTEHKFKLEDIKDGTTYHVRIRSIDTDQNVTSSDDNLFSTPAMPAITDLKVSEVSANTATITWNTNVNSDSNVEFASTTPVVTQITEGRANGEEAPTAIQTGQQGKSDSTTIHQVTIIGLVDRTTYTLKAKSKDQFGNEIVSGEISLTTTSDVAPPKIENLKSEITSTGSGDTIKYQAVVSWDSDESSTSQVEFGQGVNGEYDQSTKEDLSLNQTHVVIINDLKSNSAYHFRVKTRDKSGNSAYSDDTSIITPPKVKSLIQMIVNTISDSFSWISKFKRK